MSKLEVVLLLVALVNVGIVVEFVRRRELQEGFALLWIGTGLLGVVFVAARGAIDALARSIGVSYGANLVLAGGIAFLTVVVMSLSLHVSRLEAKVERLAEEITFLRLGQHEAETPST